MKKLECDGDDSAERYANALAYLQFALVTFDLLEDSFAGLHVQSAIDAIAERDAHRQSGNAIAVSSGS